MRFLNENFFKELTYLALVVTGHCVLKEAYIVINSC